MPRMTDGAAPTDAGCFDYFVLLNLGLAGLHPDNLIKENAK